MNFVNFLCWNSLISISIELFSTITHQTNCTSGSKSQKSLQMILTVAIEIFFTASCTENWAPEEDENDHDISTY